MSGAVHEVHHIITHTLDMHHYHGQHHANHSTDRYHHHGHGDLIDAILEMQSSDEKNEEHPTVAIIILYEHMNARQISMDDFYSDDNQDYCNSDLNKTQQHFSQPEIPPPKYFSSLVS